MTRFVNIRTVYEAERRSVAALAGLYQNHEWLVETIKSVAGELLCQKGLGGKRVLLKPNWVRHDKTPQDEICLRTHDAFLLAALEAVLKAQPKSVLIGDAPIQGCHWSKVATQSLVEDIEKLAAAHAVPVAIKDFRRVTFDPAANDGQENRRPLDEYLIFDVGKESFLEPITDPYKNNFRVMFYNPDRFRESHGQGMHKYCITRELFESDVVISLPKVKTHQKAGITAALKNIVGVNGDKDFLPHHRLGGTARGGDCYPGDSKLRLMAELAYDQANRKKGSVLFTPLKKLGSLLWRLSLPGQYDDPGAAWFGNDTTWRMVMDLNLIVHFGTPEGSLSETPQREFYSLCDGIIGGQGNGPLFPEPLPLGIVSFTNSSPLNDICMAHLMGMQCEKIPLLVAAHEFIGSDERTVRVNGQVVPINELESLSVEAIMPPGWVGYDQA